MPIADHPLLNDPSLTSLILHAAAEGPVEPDALLRRLAALLAQAHEHAEIPPDELRAHLRLLAAELARAGLLTPDPPHHLTEEGRVALEEHPHGLDRADLAQFPPYAEALHREAAAGGRPEIGPHDGTHPAAYHSGVAARVDGRALSDNPYPPDTSDHLAWENGWAEANPEPRPG